MTTARHPGSEGPRAAVDPDLVAAARALRLDRVAGITVDRLRAAGVPSILLKGATIATWLYDDGHPRPYRDVDLLVSPLDAERAKEVLGKLGFVHAM
ncbi:MAG: nucleotidyltransferase family protein, partial [Actinomycetota bacterium]|nr:nucleotidyltransferase family protein [Actinomycetota bacterium]